MQLVNLVSAISRHRPVPWIWQLRLILDEHLPVLAPELVQPHHLGAVEGLSFSERCESRESLASQRSFKTGKTGKR